MRWNSARVTGSPFTRATTAAAGLLGLTACAAPATSSPKAKNALTTAATATRLFLMVATLEPIRLHEDTARARRRPPGRRRRRLERALRGSSPPLTRGGDEPGENPYGLITEQK